MDELSVSQEDMKFSLKKNKKQASRLTSGGIRAPSLTVLPSTVMW